MEALEALEEALKEAATTKKHKDNANSTKVTSVTDYDNMPGSPKVTRLKDELADIRKKKYLLIHFKRTTK